jgi:hypothetical protein
MLQMGFLTERQKGAREAEPSFVVPWRFDPIGQNHISIWERHWSLWAI